jgi:hypothetical protein
LRSRVEGEREREDIGKRKNEREREGDRKRSIRRERERA